MAYMQLRIDFPVRQITETREIRRLEWTSRDVGFSTITEDTIGEFLERENHSKTFSKKKSASPANVLPTARELACHGRQSCPVF
jgi:hypothetical protein